MTFADLAYRSYYEPQQLPPGMAATLEATARFTSQTMIHWANATHACTCEVDVDTGHVTLTRYIVSEDVGPMINPNVVEGQIAGGTVQGIGGALLENMAYDDDGNPLSSTFVDYLLPTATEVPHIEYGHVEIPGPGVGGYKGCGEGGAIGSTPAVINAINDALAPLGVTSRGCPPVPRPSSRPSNKHGRTASRGAQQRIPGRRTHGQDVGGAHRRRTRGALPARRHAAVRRRRRVHRRGQGQGRPDHRVLQGRSRVSGEGRRGPAHGAQGQRQGDPRQRQRRRRRHRAAQGRG